MMHESRLKFLFGSYLFVISFTHSACSQRNIASEHLAAPLVITSYEVYQKSIKGDFTKSLVPLKNYITPLFSEWKYATTNNFIHEVLYENPAAFVRLPAAVALQKVQKELALKGLSLKFFDAYRPYNVTKKMWKVVPDERYAANPAKGSGHNRGAAVDVTLVKLSSGEELAMPTDFDDFTEKAHHNYMNLPAEKIENRKLLRTVMEKNGFLALETEWWHYSLPNAASKYELLDLSFEQLKKLEHDQ